MVMEKLGNTAAMLTMTTTHDSLARIRARIRFLAQLGAQLSRGFYLFSFPFTAFLFEPRAIPWPWDK